MFERSFLPPGRTARPWTVLVSFAGQMALVGLAVLVPLIYNETLPAARLIDILLAPTPPPGRPTESSPPKMLKMVAKAPPRAITEHGLIAPATVPSKVALLIEEPLETAPTSYGEAGVPGGIGTATSLGNSALARMIESIPKPAEPPPAALPKPETPPVIRRIVVGGLVQAAKLISQPLPVYPALARQARISGVVKLHALIGADGAIANLRLISGHPLLAPAAMEAVKKWRYQPTLLNGNPVEVDTEVSVTFALN